MRSFSNINNTIILYYVIIILSEQIICFILEVQILKLIGNSFLIYEEFRSENFSEDLLYRKVEWKIERDSFQFEILKITAHFSYKDTIDFLFQIIIESSIIRRWNC